MAKKTKDSSRSIEERLKQALIPNWDEPYKLPDNWCWVKLSNVSVFERGITFPASAKETSRTSNNIPCLRTANVQETLDVEDLLFIDKSYMKDNPNKLVQENDIIMSTANSRELVGKTSFVDSLTEDMTFGGFIMAIRSKIDPKYLFYFLRLQFTNGKFMGSSTQTTNIANINSTSLGETETPVPPLDEQQRIVERIESLFVRLDEAKEKAQEVVDGFETRKAAILHKAFSGELTSQWREKNGEEFLWKTVKFDDVVSEVRLGLVRGKVEQSYDKEYPYLKMNNITADGRIDIQDLVYVNADESEVTTYALSIGDFLFNTRNSFELVGKNTVWNATINGIVLFNNNIMRVRFVSGINPYFISYYFNSSEGKVKLDKCKKNTTNIAAIYAKNLNDIVVPIASFDEQTEIVRILNCLFAKELQIKETAEAVIEQIETMKKAILVRAFRGELGTNDPTEESAMELLKRVLNAPIQAKTSVKRVFIPKDLDSKIKTELERKIIKLYIKNDVDILPINQIMNVSSEKFEIMEALRNLQQRGILVKEKDYYKLLG